jgi:hypothetical protein
MNQSSSLPRKAPREVLNAQLRQCLEGPGPFVSGAVRGVDLSAAEFPNEAGERLETAFEEMKTAIGNLRSGFVAFVINSSGSVVWRLYDDEIDHSRLDFGPCPTITTFLEAEQRLAHHMVALVAGTSVEIATFPRHGSPTLHRTEIANSESRRHIIGSAAKTADTALVVIAAPGDELDALLSDVRLEVPIGIELAAVDTDQWDSSDDVADRVVAEVSSLAASRTVELLRLLRFARSHDLVHDDVIDTLRGLREESPRRLFLTPDLDDRRMAWFGSEPQQIALDLEDAAHSLGDVELEHARLRDVLVRSALLQGADVHIVPHLPDETLPGGMGLVVSAEGDGAPAF